MKHLGKRILSFMCAACLLVSSAGDLGLFALAAGEKVVLTRELTASDDQTYRVTVSYDEDAGIPEDAELLVTEIGEENADYAAYVARSAEEFGKTAGNVLFAKVFDITLRSPETGEEYQPNQDVRVSIELLQEEQTALDSVDVVHFHGEAEDGAEVMDASVDGETVAFATGSFSVFVVLNHSGDAAPVNPRLEFHYLSHDFTAGAGGTYTAGGYPFLNTHEDHQTSQILVDGEALEMVTNPPNETAAGQPTKYFFGWYLVDKISVAGDGTVTYRWTDDPERILDSKPVSITVDGANIKWKLNGVEHTSPMDALGCAHVYLAPIYENYYFVNFHMGAEGTLKATNIVARKLVVLGDDNKADIVINDVTAPADSSYEIFTGWKPAASDTIYTTVDSAGNPIGNQTDGTYTITLTDANFTTSQGYDLYPVFTDARWIFFDTGLKGNGSTYVSAQWSFTSDLADYPYVKNGGRMPVSRRNGYVFKGWYASQTNNNGSGRQLTDENGWFVNEVVNGTGWKIEPGAEHGTLYLYEALDRDTGLTLYAKWEAITNTTYSVIIWRQSIEDSPYAADAEKTYDFAASVKEVPGLTGQQLSDLNISAYTGYSGSGEYEGFTYRTAVLDTGALMSDGSSVVNVYYDRNKHTLNFYDQITGYDYTETEADTPTTQWAFVDGEWTQLRREQRPTSYVYSYGPVYNATDAENEGQYGVVDGAYVPLTRIDVMAPGYTYKRFDENATDEPATQYRLLNGEYVPLTRETASNLVWTPEYEYTALSANDNSTSPQYGIYQGEYFLLTFVPSGSNIPYTYTTDGYNGAEGVSGVTYYGNNRYNGYIQIYYRNGAWRTGNTNNSGRYTRGAVYEHITQDTWYRDTYTPHTARTGRNDVDRDDQHYHSYFVFENGVYRPVQVLYFGGSWYDTSYISYGSTVYERATSAVYTGTRYSRAAGETPYTGSDRLYLTDDSSLPYTYASVNGSDEGTQYYVDANGGHVKLNRSGDTGYEWKYQGETYGGTRYVQTDVDVVYNGKLYLPDGAGGYTETNEDGDGRWGVDTRGGHVALSRVPVFDHYGYQVTATGDDYTGGRYELGTATTTYTGKRYKLVDGVYQETTDETGTLYAKDLNGVYRLLTVTADAAEYVWYINGTNTVWHGTRYERSNTTSYGWRLVYVMEALYQQSLAAQFDELAETYNNGERWMPQKKEYFQQVLVFLDIMPDVDEDFRKNTSNYSLKTLTYYAEVLPGESYDTQRNGKYYKVYHTTSARYGYFTETEDFLDILGYTKYEANPAFVNGEVRNQNSIALYYTRNNYNFTFVYNYPTVAGTTIDGEELTNEQINKEYAQSVPFEANLATYGDLSSFAPDESEIPDGYVFSGWYVDDVGNTAYEFTGTMPPNHLRVFAKWDTLRYRVMADPNGGVLDGINHNIGAYNAYKADYIVDGVKLSEGIKPFREDGSGYYSNGSYTTYTNIRYGRTWSLDPEIKREYIPISDETAEALGLTDDEIFYYVNTQSLADDGSTGLPAALRNALYITQTELKLRDEYEVGEEPEPYTYWEFYRSAVNYNVTRWPGNHPGIQNHPYGYYAWLDAYVEKQENGKPQKYRHVNPGEVYTFIGWYQVFVDDETGEEYLSSMPYDQASPISGDTKVRAVWRLDGSYQIQYHPEFYLQIDDEHTVYINGTMPFWFDPAETNGTLPKYTDQATTNIYRQPDNIMVDGVPILDEEYIFLGWQLVTPNGDGTFTPVSSIPPYDPSDPFTVDAKYADKDQIIHMQAVYEKKSDSKRRVSVSGLSLDANEENYASAYLVGDTLPVWNAVGTSTKGDSQRINFSNMQANDEVELFRYATSETVNGETGKNYFAYLDKFVLIGFHEQGDPALNRYIPRFSADGVIAAPRGETDNVLYAVWEPMVYINFVNDTDKNDFDFAGKDITFSMTSDDLQTLYVVNEVTGAFERAPYEDLSSIEVKVGEKLRLAIPYGEDKSVTIDGTNDQGNGILLTLTSTKKEGENTVVLHDPVEVRNGKPYTDTETLLTDAVGVTVTFTVTKADYTMLFKDNYEGGGEEEFYYKSVDIDENDAFLSDPMPRRGRVGYSFLGWAMTPDATEAVYTMDQQIDHLKGFFDTNDTDDDGIVELYGVWESDAKRGYLKVQKEVPVPGSSAATFDFEVELAGNAKRGSSYGTENITAAKQTFSLTDGQYLYLHEEQWPANNSNSGINNLRVRLTMQIYNYKENQDDEAVGSPVTVTWVSQYGGTYPTLNPKILITETGTGSAVVGLDKYETTVELAPGALQPEGSGNDSLMVDSAARKVTWDNPANSGGTAIVTNQRKTADITVAKILVDDPFETIRSFPFTAEVTKLDDGEAYTVDPASFSVFNADEGRVTIPGIPTGSTLTLTEAEDGAFETTAVSAKGATDLDSADNVFAFAVTEDDTVTFTNTMIQVPVKIVLRGYDGENWYDKVEARFSLYESGQQLYRPVDNKLLGSATNLIYEGNLAVGDYTLYQSWIQLEGYMKLVSDGMTAVHVTPDGVEIDSPAVYKCEKDENGVWQIWVINWKTTTVRLVKDLIDPLGEKPTFTFKLAASFGGTAFDLGEDTVTLGGGGSRAATVPVGAEVSIRETGVANYTTSAFSTHDPDGDNYNAASTTYTLTVPTTGGTVTFRNARNVVPVVVKKTLVDLDDDTNVFTFTTQLMLNGKLIGNYTLWDDGDEIDEPEEDLITGETTGEVSFDLGRDESITLTIPVGVRFQVTESAAHTSAATPEPVDLIEYETTASAVYTDDDSAYGTASNYRRDSRSYVVASIPTRGLTITFRNSPGGVDVIFGKIDGFGTPLPGATFTLYTDADCAAAHALQKNGVTVTGVSADGTATYQDADGNTLSVGTVYLEKIPIGVYYMKETGAHPTTADGVRWANGSTYVVVVGDAELGKAGTGVLQNVTAAQLEAQTGTGSGAHKYAIFLSQNGKAAAAGSTHDAADIAAYGVMNRSEAEHKVILEKIDNTNIFLTGAVFDILRYDRTVVAEGCTSGSAGCFWVGQLPYGTYYLHETTVPDGYAKLATDDNWFVLTVNASGTTVSTRLTKAP